LNRFFRYGYALFILIFCTHALAAKAEEWSLLIHTPEIKFTPLALSAPQQQWLANKHALVIGILPTDAPPYGIRNTARQYEGLSADYIGLIAEQLGLQVQIQKFDQPEQMWKALASHEIDLVPSVTVGENGQSFSFSTPYATEIPVLAVKSEDNDPLPVDLAETRVAMPLGYMPIDAVKRAWPSVRLQVYDSYQEALSAVAFGNSRAFLGNSYLVGRNLFNNLKLERLSDLPERNIGFAMPVGDTMLKTLVNQALQNIPVENRFQMQQFWQAGARSTLTQFMQPVQLTPAEARWVEQHPTVNVLLYGRYNTAPIAFLDSDNQVRGIAVDVLRFASV